MLPPSRPDLISDAPITATGVLPNSEDASVIVRPFTLLFDAVAEIARIPRVNVYHRAVQIMNDLVPRAAWSAEGEGHLRATLNAAGLEFGYRRPRARLARRALFHVIAELIDGGRISEQMVSRLLPVLTFDDPGLLFWEPAKRPPEVSRTVRRDDYRDRNEEWIERLEEIRSLVRPARERLDDSRRAHDPQATGMGPSDGEPTRGPV